MFKNSYFSRKLHSLLGVIPVGFFLIEHLLTNYSAAKGGPESFLEHVEWLHSLPLVLALEIFGIWIPLAYHAIYGLYVAYTARNNVNNYGYFRNVMFFLQRVTGVVTFLFVAWHFFQTRFQIAIGSVEQMEIGSHMHQIASNPVYFVLYVIGVIAAVFHFSNGMWSFLVSWGITVGPRAQRVSTYVWMGVFVVMSAMFIMSLTAFLDPAFQHVTSVTKG
ncbi:succinate dehydrogenase cytochrome b558 subunit [Paenibacillus validus]|uniref:Succinate dehydrogenase n=1 Tax=Paenibacillus validus TaxID=44253 RepID=A0A7X2ZB99_9BACL|nr:MULTISPECIES: succinate dehydrogenase cytochrome b558 subunit [Paenibacillus]MED4600450.1 succinate dehydrogenase cytochrome b558 subunit [Paenibacillus validus]MED4604710.1 succinate dehydrogenase cytochrome b558 subunit [Paenibacillus validus]MUG71063.1 succinate dehydrogenase [Paenibacillus validus]